MSEITSTIKGLTPAQAEESRRLHGTNVMTPPPKKSVWLLFLEKFADPLIIILLVAGILSIGISCYEYFCLREGGGVFFEPAGIFVAIILATGLSFIFEHKAEKEFEMLNKVSDDDPVEVVRGGAPASVPKRDIVAGDIVILHTGDEVPADGRILESVTLRVDESTLTGEPIARKSEKKELAVADATFPTDMVYRGTKVMEGHAVMEVTAVGDSSEAGKVYAAASAPVESRTPLDEQFDRLGRFISIASYAIGALVIVGRCAMYLLQTPFEWDSFIMYLLQSVMIAVTLVVCSVPEGLPMAVTLALAYSMRRMIRTNNLVRKMHACETMGATTVICTDKTGTLTTGRMQVADSHFFGNPSDEIIAEAIALNSTASLDLSRPDAPAILGNPTEGALLLWLHSKGTDYRALRENQPVVAEIPFSTERKYMATIAVTADGTRTLFLKGAPEIVFGKCSDTCGLTKEEIDATLLDYQNRGMRTLGFAYRRIPEDEVLPQDGDFSTEELTFLGIAAISDPVRSDVPQAIREVTEAGIEVKIVTGDTPATAREIGRQTGIWSDSDSEEAIITGPEVAALSDEELRKKAPRLKIIARARPLDKKRLVEALMQNGRVVAVTGDGTNDAPALKAAHVGLSMGDGTAVAKEASDITILDNSFSSIGRAVMWGRSLYRNIQRFILFQMTVNVTACLIVLAGAFLSLESPLTVTQMLWVNLIMDTFAAVALASLPPTKTVMKETPRKNSDFIISPAMTRNIIATGITFFIFLLGILLLFRHIDFTSLAGIFSSKFIPIHTMSAYELSLFFTIFIFLQFWNLFNAKAFASHRSAFHFHDCGSFVLIASLIFIGQIAIVELGGAFFNVVPLHFTDWLLIIAVTALTLLPELWQRARR